MGNPKLKMFRSLQPQAMRCCAVLAYTVPTEWSAQRASAHKGVRLPYYLHKMDMGNVKMIVIEYMYLSQPFGAFGSTRARKAHDVDKAIIPNANCHHTRHFASLQPPEQRIHRHSITKSLGSDIFSPLLDGLGSARHA
ncbi:hypothetical protein EV126DRAFT_452779 [Verticillium dahliae]|nr:hypothetical protein EV126DRAFT_452779 [Verticillium dahliae]